MSTAPLAEFSTACAAPYTTLHFDPRGVVRVCCENRLHVVGRVPSESLDEIWHGERLERLRRAVEAGKLDLGCNGCADGIRSGARSTCRAGLYDDLKVSSRTPPSPIRLELELSNRCNLQCVMCNGELSSSIRSQREHLPPLPAVYGHQFFEDLGRLAPDLVHVSFQGGEPFLARESMRAFDVLIDCGFEGRCHVTTNGTIVNSRVERVLERLDVDVSISVDGATRETVEAVRVGASHQTILANIAWFQAKAVVRGSSIGLHYCLMPGNTDELREFLSMADQLDVEATVINVSRPVTYAVERLDHAALGEVVALFDAQDAAAPALGRNRAVWEHQRELVDSWLGSSSGTSVAVPQTGGVQDRTGWASHEISGWADERGVHRLELDAAERVLAVTPRADDVLGMDLSTMIGGSIREVIRFACDRFGDFDGTTVLTSPSETEDRVLYFESPAGSTTMRSIVVSARQGRPGTLFLAVKEGRATVSAPRH